MSPEGAISLLSSLLQTVVGFAGLVVVAYVFLDEALRETDEERADFNDARRRKFFSQLRPILYLTLLVAVAIAATITGLHGSSSLSFILTSLVSIVILVSFATLLVIMNFAVRILDPDRVKDKDIIESETQRVIAPFVQTPRQVQNPESPAGEFLAKYRTLEDEVRKRLGTTDLRRLPAADLAFALELNKVLSGDDASKLLALRRVRNLLVHGRAREVDGRTMSLLNELLAKLDTNATRNIARV